MAKVNEESMIAIVPEKVPADNIPEDFEELEMEKASEKHVVATGME